MTRPTVKQADAVNALVILMVREICDSPLIPEEQRNVEGRRVRDQVAFALRDMVREEIRAMVNGAFLTPGAP